LKAVRCGLVAADGATSDLPFGNFDDRTVYVIDVAGLEEDAQDRIFARVVTKLREHLEKRDLGVQHVVVFVDELNKYAPGDGPETYVRKMLLKGQLMVRHPHFTQPIFVRFPRPAVMRGRDGVSQYPAASLETAVLRALRTLDPSLTLAWLQDTVQLASDDEILRARNAIVRERPGDVRKAFASHFRSAVAPRTATRPTAPAPLPTTPADDPYGF